MVQSKEEQRPIARGQRRMLHLPTAQVILNHRLSREEWLEGVYPRKNVIKGNVEESGSFDAYFINKCLGCYHNYC